MALLRSTRPRRSDRIRELRLNIVTVQGACYAGALAGVNMGPVHFQPSTGSVCTQEEH